MGLHRPAARLLAACLLTALAATTAAAGPIQPDLERLVREAQVPPLEFAPARAGWNGPETASGAAPVPSLAVDAAYQARQVRASLLQAVIPEPRVLAALLVLILLLRRFHYQPQRAAPVTVLPERGRRDPELRQAA